MKHLNRMITATVATAACVAAVATVAFADEPRSGTAAHLAAEAPSPLVEDYVYPQAEKIKEERGIVLKRGDGHIILAECGSSSDLMVVYSRTTGQTCFRTIGKIGYLSVEIPAVYGIKGSSSHKTDVTLTVEESEQKVALAKDEWKGVGQSTDPQGRDHTLIELSTSA
ncbi:hypothetical protein [Streptomyces globisporus]|uniref:hypothetical protein n=1 Tax=Streptomyces globisporus TaxID=1908 RepID=UPI00382DE8C8